MPTKFPLALSSKVVAGLGTAVVATVLVAAPSASLLAQEATARAVVQPLPSPEVRELDRALRHLARRPRDVNALIAAGSASLKLNDLDAAIGFYGRAEEVAPNNPRVKMGQAAVLLRSGRAIDALQLFAEAEAAGAQPRDVLSDRGLAYDLIGDQVRAQAHYREALKVSSTDTVTIRRLALSYAISGQKPAFESVLKPLVDGRDFAAFRTQAFGLAILGEQERAAAVTEVVMPADLAVRITPYLAFMPQLTKAQQAAASNLGIFPLPADVGRDDPRIADFAARSSADLASAPLAQAADARLEPAGEPLGEPDTARARVIPAPEIADAEIAAQTVRLAEVSTPTPAIATPESAQIVVPPKASEPAPNPGFDLGQVAAVDAATPAPSASSPDVAVVAPQGAVDAPSAVISSTISDAPAVLAEAGPAIELPAASNPVAAVVEEAVTASALVEAAAPAEQVAEVEPARAAAELPLPTRELETATLAAVEQPAATITPVTANPTPTTPSATADFADAFAAFGEPDTKTVAVADDAVDIAAIGAAGRSAASRTISAPSENNHPRRIWVQVATGKDSDALRFDWGRLSRKSEGALSEFTPHIVAWGQSNRLLAGPLDSQSAARDLVNALSQAGIDTFSYTSPEGREIQELR
ncbi:MAG: SPOR domain-containing protein [Erythrobacter sp.]